MKTNRMSLFAVACCAIALGIATSCKPANREGSATPPDSLGALPTNVTSIPVKGRSDLLETSSATMTPSQPGIVFTINDSGNEPILFALDSTGSVRGSWRIANADDIDWESSSHGKCLGPKAASLSCIFIGDAGDNQAHRDNVVMYQVPEPTVTNDSAQKTLAAEALVFRYPDQPHDVEAMYVSGDGTTYLITKRKLKNSRGDLRSALVFTLPSSAWNSHETVVATLVDSLPIVPGSAEDRTITDASLSFDSQYLAIRTYLQIYTFVTDSVTGRVVTSIAPAICNIDGVEKVRGEGVTWFGATRSLLVNSEGLNEPMHRVTCPLPQRQ
ncbi:MAG: hypothetical protein ABJB66_05355 [Gemmatimonadaceae bacterium]